MGKQKLNSSRGAKQLLPTFFMKRLSEGSFIIIVTFALLVLLSLLTYDFNEQTLSKNNLVMKNSAGQVGAYIACNLYHILGYLSFLLPLGFVYLAWLILKDRRLMNKLALLLRSSGFMCILLGGDGLLSLENRKAGGILGSWVFDGFSYAVNAPGAILLLLAMFLVGVTLLTGLSWIQVIEGIGYYTSRIIYWSLNAGMVIAQIVQRQLNAIKKRKLLRVTQPNLSALPKKKTKKSNQDVIPSLGEETIAGMLTDLKETKPKPLPKQKHPPHSTKSLPSLDLLEKGGHSRTMGGFTPQVLETLSREVEQHLLDFGIQADVVAVHPGPVITRFELQLAPGIKVSKLSALAKDLARSLSVVSVRVVEVIPGKTVVGLELPNQYRTTVRLGEVFSTEAYQAAHSSLALALGVDIAGHAMIVDLAKMPHLLVAGTTGSGKSVGINAMILSILFKSTPEQVRLIMIDPKMLELSVYDGIPHLLTPVVTDMKEAANALRWCVAEMERRYRLMAALGVRNLIGFNTKLTEAQLRGESLVDPLWKPNQSMDEKAPLLISLPYIVVVIDELADMMMVVGKKVEQLIARIAQKARAAGIHLILATQRPSVDVLTGLIKSNIPTRISFQVSSKIDSRTILDQQGAEQLLGHGDMLYSTPGSGVPLRVHGAFVDDKEVHRSADAWRAQGEPEYIEEITQTLEGLEGGLGEETQSTEDKDPLYDQAVEFVIQTRKASTSAVQRRFKIGYNRAARLVEEMERTGIVGSLDGGIRDVLVNPITEE